MVLQEVKMTSRPVALVTGGAGGIGSAISRMFGANGVDVLIHFNQSAGAADELATELREIGCRAEIVQADLLADTGAQLLVDECVEHYGRLDHLVNNAGWTQAVPEYDLAALDDRLIERTVRLKVHAPLYCIRAAQPLLASSPGASIVNITSVSGIIARGSNHIYAAANAALSALTRSLARSLAPEVRVNAVAPGFVNTGFAWAVSGDMADRVADNNYIGRAVQPEEVAAVVKLLCLDSQAITGEEIVVDGGIARLGKRGSAK